MPTQPPFIWTGCVLLLIAALWLWRRKAQGSKPDEPACAPADPTPDRYTQLACELSELAAEYRNGARTNSEAILMLDGLLRATIAVHTAAPAQHLTSAELLGLAVHFPGQTAAALNSLLPLFDCVKFADLQPDTAQTQAALAATSGVIDALQASGAP